MKTTTTIFFFLLVTLTISSQNTILSLSGLTAKETVLLDSLKYKTNHSDRFAALKETQIISEKLTKLGYLNSQYSTSNRQTKSDTLFVIFSLKNKIDTVHLYIGKCDTKKEIRFQEKLPDTITIPYNKLEEFLNLKYRDLENDGKPFSKLRLDNITNNNNILFADLIIQSENKRIINSIIYNSSDNKKSSQIPKGHQKFLDKKFIGKDFNTTTMNTITNEISKITFLKQSKYPEVLFKNDSTTIYTYLEKNNSNTFDGYLGFSNKEDKKIKPNGYLNFELQNILHAGESFSLYWKNNEQEEKIVHTKLEIPFIFQTPLLAKAELQIFTQDSTYQNMKSKIGLGFILNFNSKINLNYEILESSNIQKIASIYLDDFKTKTTAIEYLFSKTSNNKDLIDTKTSLSLQIGIGKRHLTGISKEKIDTEQFAFESNFKHNFILNSKNFITIHNTNYILKSDNYLTNELYRFGGQNTIRGFLENSLQAKFATLLQTNYTYILNHRLSVSSVIDLGIYKEILTNNKVKKLKGFGAEINLKTNNNYIKLSLVKGVNGSQDTDLQSTILSIFYNIKF